MIANIYLPHQFQPDCDSSVLELTLPATPMTLAYLADLEDTLCAIEDDHPDALLVLKSSVDGAKGLEYSEFCAATAAGPHHLGRAEKVWRHWDKLPNAKIALLHGPVLAFAATLALACDSIIMHENATLAWDEVQHGITAGMAAWLLPKLVGLSRARDLLLTGRALQASEGVQWGLVQATFSESISDASQDTEANTAASSVSACAEIALGQLLSQISIISPAARIATRQLLRETWGMAYENAIGICLAAQARCLNAQTK